MPQAHVILLANFYGSYLGNQKFRAAVIVNNAGIEQLATLGVEKLKEVRETEAPDDAFYMLIVAGLTDVLIKSVEEGKNKLEITPNSMQLLETKMQWANSLLTNEGAKLIWAIMPPISLRMYHISEGWNINKIPGMSNGLDKEQRTLNGLMFSYRNLCVKFNYKEARKLCNGPYFTDLVSELSHDRGTMNLNTGYFESDGISPTTKLVENWASQVNKIFLATEKLFRSRPRTPPKPRTPPETLANAGQGDSWDLPPPRSRGDERGDRSLKRPYDDDPSFSGSRGLHGLGNAAAYDFERNRKEMRDREQGRYASHMGEEYPPSKIPSLVDMAKKLDPPRHRPEKPAVPSLPDHSSSEMATAVQLLAATMQLGGGNPNNVQSVLKALMSQKEADDRKLEDERIKRRLDEERAMLKKREEARRLEELKLKRIEENRREEARYRDEMRRREEDRRREERLLEERRQIEIARRQEDERVRQVALQRRAAEDQRLREIQIAAKLAMEQQKREEERQRKAVKLLQDQQAQMALIAVTKNVRDQIAQNRSQEMTSPFNSAKATLKASNALDRINEKLRTDREKKEPPVKIDRNIAKDPLWASPVVLFSFINRTNDTRPLRGIQGQKLSRNSSKLSDLKSRGQWIYTEPGSPAPSVGLLKIKVRQPGVISDFETKVARYNNRVIDMLDECSALIQEGRTHNYIVRGETDEAKNVTNSNSIDKSSMSVSKPASSSAKPATFGSVSSEKPTPKVELAGEGKVKDSRAEGKFKDLRDNLNRTARHRARSSTPSDMQKTSSQTAARRSIEAKPRWDNSDESEEELLWDDDHVSVKAAVDDDDVKFVEERNAPDDTDETSEATHGNEHSAKDASEKELGQNVKEEVTENSQISNGDRFVTVDAVESSAQKDDRRNQDDCTSENFLTIDEAA